MTDALIDRLVVAVFALVFEKPGDLAHVALCRALFRSLHGRGLRLEFIESATILDWHHLTKLGIPDRPFGENLRRHRRMGKMRVPRNQEPEPRGVSAAHVGHYIHETMRFKIAGLTVNPLVDLFLGRHRLKLHHGETAARGESVVFVEHVGDAAGHAGGEVSASTAENDDDATGHIFAAMVAGAFDHGDRPGIAHGETLTGDAAEIAFALDGAVQHGVADDDGLLGNDGGVGRGAHDNTAAGQALADIVVGIAFQFKGHAARKERAETLYRRTGKTCNEGIAWQAVMAVTLGNLAGQHRAGSAVGIRNRQIYPHRRAAVERALRLGDELAVNDAGELVVLSLAIVDGDAGGRWR